MVTSIIERQQIIKVADLRAEFAGNVVFDEVNFHVNRGEVFVILGGSGCGKTTMLKHMIGLYRPVSGRIEIDGDDLVGADAATRRRIMRKIGVMYQSGALFGSLNLLDNVRLPLEEFTGLPEAALDAVARAKLRLVQLDGFEHHLPSQISGGMKKRAAIARALALEPQIAFLDEPSAGLDPITSAELDDLILELAGTLKITFVVVTHELASIYKIADRVIMLDKRTRGIIASGPPAYLRDHSSDAWVRRFFRRETAQAVAQGTGS